MSGWQLDELARRHGIVLQHHGLDGQAHTVSDATKRAVLASLGVEAGPGQDLSAALQEAEGYVAPVLWPVEGQRCFMPDWLRDERVWGISLQVYELRSRRNWGIGDFADLAEFCRIAAAAGAEFVGTNPLHALFLAEPSRRSPFSPSSRLFLNPLYIAVDRVPGYSEMLEDRAAIEQLRRSALVDYDGVAALKLDVLSRIWRSWRAEAGSTDAGKFEQFREEGGEALRRHALFEALSMRMVANGHGSGWKDWPAQYRTCGAPEVDAFAEDHHDEVQFHVWLQWLADAQLAEAAAAAREAGMRIGLYLDLAVGEEPDGSATWSSPEESLPGISIGAPPDFFTANGQNWNLSPLSPDALKRSGFDRYRRMIRASMRHAGALRIDHAMSLWQLFFIPEDGAPAEGAYVRYPIDGLIRVLAELSSEWRSMVIGEDLGNVPDGFRWVMEQSGILSYRILYFEERDGHFLAAHDYPALALACLSTHDLPTLKGWWSGDDIGLRSKHGLIDEQEAQRQSGERRHRRERLVDALRWAQCLSQEELGAVEQALRDEGSELPEPLMTAAHRFVARTPSMLAGVRLADLAGEVEPANLPGTIDSYPNWRVKSSIAIEDLTATPLFRSITAAVAAERPRRG